MENNNESFMDIMKEFENEASNLSEFLNTSNESIRILEKTLINLKTNFPYKKYVLTENIFSANLEPTGIFWSLSWEPCVNKYRLFIISEENNKVTFKKPLIECKIEMRLKFVQYIIPFVNSFKKKLAEYRISLSQE